MKFAWENSVEVWKVMMNLLEEIYAGSLLYKPMNSKRLMLT